MNNIARRSLVLVAVVLLAMSAVSAIPTPLHSRPASALGGPGPRLVPITGGGIGSRSADPAPVVTHYGNYSASGQLGTGRYVFEDGDAAGTATFTRSDGMKLTGTTQKQPGQCGVIPVSTYCLVVYLSGTADIASAYLRLAVLVDFGKSARSSFLMTGHLGLSRIAGYRMVTSDGATYEFGGMQHLGDARITSATDIDLTKDRYAYWIVNAAGQVYCFGDARHFGNANIATFAAGEIVTSLSAIPSNNGYWQFTSRGRALPFGEAKSFGDLSTTPLKGRIIGAVATPTGQGYYMVGSDGGVFAFGDAKFRGSMGSARLNKPIVGLVPNPDNTGYWLVAADGGVFSFNAPFRGSLGALRLNRPIVGMVPYGNGYLMVASDGGVFNFSNGPFFGSLANKHIGGPIVSAGAGS